MVLFAPSQAARKRALHSFAFPAVEMNNFGGYSALMNFECFEPATMAKRHVGIRLREVA